MPWIRTISLGCAFVTNLTDIQYFLLLLFGYFKRYLDSIRISGMTVHTCNFYNLVSFTVCWKFNQTFAMKCIKPLQSLCMEKVFPISISIHINMLSSKSFSCICMDSDMLKFLFVVLLFVLFSQSFNCCWFWHFVCLNLPSIFSE